MVDLEILEKFTWCEPLRIIQPGDTYAGWMRCFGIAKARWKNGTEHPLNVSILFEPNHGAFDLKTYVNKFHNAILSIQTVLKDEGAELI